MLQLLGADGRRRRLAGAELLVEAGKDRLDAGERIRSDVHVGGLLAVAQAARGVVQLDPEGLAPVMPAADVVGKARADREHDVRGLVHLPAERREIAAGNAEPEWMVVEQAARRQRGGEQGAAAIGELDHRIPCARPQHAAAAEDDRPLGRGQRLDGLGNELGIGMHAPDLGLVHRRGLVGLVRHVLDLLQVVRNAQHHRLSLVLGDVEGLAHVVHHARHAMGGDVTRPGRRHQRRLVDGLIVELGVDRRLAGEHHHRQAGASRGRQRRHQLAHAGAACDGGNRDLVGCDVVGCRRRHGDVLVPDVDALHTRQFGEGGRPVHVAVAHQDELRVDSLGEERFGEGFVEFWHGRGTLKSRPADGTLAAVAIVGIWHLPLTAPRKRYRGLRAGGRGHDLFSCRANDRSSVAFDRDETGKRSRCVSPSMRVNSVWLHVEEPAPQPGCRASSAQVDPPPRGS